MTVQYCVFRNNQIYSEIKYQDQFTKQIKIEAPKLLLFSFYSSLPSLYQMYCQRGNVAKHNPTHNSTQLIYSCVGRCFSTEGRGRGWERRL